ncbi:hypothetical protein N182_24785 [Sinorhizobium sp. GL2]|nr:hypothetical protein N182_24785 [Sinorhizobium sp. GL2]
MNSIVIDRTDGLASSSAIKGPCRAATVGNIVLSGLQTVDGVSLAAGDRVLVKDQAAGSENGIYVADTGPWRRAKDFNRTRDVVTGTLVYVTSGTMNGETLWAVTTTGPIAIGTTSIAFSDEVLIPPGDIIAWTVLTRSALKALDTARVTTAYLKEDGREGVFKWTTGDFSAQIAADTAEGIYVKATAIAATAGAWVRVFDGRVFARWFGTGQAAIQAANTMADDITIDRDFAITSTAAWGNGKNYLFTGTGKLSVANAVTLTIRGVVHAGIWQGLPTSAPRKIFDCTGTGKVVGIRYVKPEWWGALGNVSGGTGTDDKAALQAAHDCVEGSFASDGGRPEIELRGGANYGLGSQLTLRPTANINLKFTGAGPIFGGTRFTALASFATGSGTAAIRIDGNSDSLQKIAAFDIGNFAIVRTSGASLVGLWVGGNGTTTDLIGVQQSPIHDVYVENFGFGYRIANCRLIDFNRCSAWCQNVSASVGCLITVDGNTAFTGDMNFNDCQFVADPATGRKCVSVQNLITIGGGGGNGELKGIRFNKCIFYKGDRYLEVYAATGGHIGDLWVDAGCQFDGFGNTSIHIEADGTGSKIDDIHVLSSYFRGVNVGQVAIRVKKTGAGVLQDIHAKNNQIFSLGTGARAIVVEGLAGGGSFDDNIITDFDASTGELILVDTSQGFSVNGNKLNRSAGATGTAAWIISIGSGCNHFAVQGNISKGLATTAPVRDLTGAVTKSVANNI